VKAEPVASLLQTVNRILVLAALYRGVRDSDADEPSRMGLQHIANVVVVLVERDQHRRSNAVLSHHRQEALDGGVALGRHEGVNAAGTDVRRTKYMHVAVDDHDKLIKCGPQ